MSTMNGYALKTFRWRKNSPFYARRWVLQRLRDGHLETINDFLFVFAAAFHVVLWFYSSSFLLVPSRMLIPHVKFILNCILIEIFISPCMRLVSCAFSVWYLARWHNEWMIMIIVMTILQKFCFCVDGTFRTSGWKSRFQRQKPSERPRCFAFCSLSLSTSIPACNIRCLHMASSEKLFYSPRKFVDFYPSETPYLLFFCIRTGHLLVGICFVSMLNVTNNNNVTYQQHRMFYSRQNMRIYLTSVYE